MNITSRVIRDFLFLFIDTLRYTTVVTFGDSTTDSGQAYQLSNHTWPPVPPFNLKGGFSDGPLWNEIFTTKYLLKATLYDFACGSATTDNQLAQGNMSRSPNLVANYSIRSSTKSPGVRQQITQYINSMSSKNIDFDRTLYMIWSGTNNYYFNTSLTTLDTVQSIIDCINLLIIFGGRNLVIINEPPFDRFPPFRGKNNTNSTRQLYIDHNRNLAAIFNQTYLSLQTRLNIRLIDSHSFVSNILANYITYGFENLDSCWDTITQSTVQILCQNITKRVFCDEYHFTSRMQELVADEFYRVMAVGQNSSLIISSNLTFLFTVIICIFLLN
jgi:phospholipase/lecithinase/hemolysin